MTQQEQRIALAQWWGLWPQGSDYCDAHFSLDEVHEMENKLPPELANEWADELTKITSFGANGHFKHWFHLAHAPAAQRCEALCRVLWPDRFL